jgi:hypothetical protein
MRVIATKDELDAAPKWVSEFLKEAWEAPDGEGQRKAVNRIDQDVAKRLARCVDTGMQSKATERHFSFALNDAGGSFGQADFWNDRNLQIAFTLALVWNERKSIAACQTCGRLIVPSKGRAARFCSSTCRVNAHRRTGKDA